MSDVLFLTPPSSAHLVGGIGCTRTGNHLMLMPVKARTMDEHSLGFMNHHGRHRASSWWDQIECGSENARKEKQLEVQRRTEDDRIRSLEHLRGLVKLFLELDVPDDFCRLRHLPYQFLQPSEYPNQAALKLICQLRKINVISLPLGRTVGHRGYLADLRKGCPLAPLHHCIHKFHLER